MFKPAITVAVTLTLVGCSSLPLVTSGLTGCPVERLVLSDIKRGAMFTWKARCADSRGREIGRYACSAYHMHKNCVRVGVCTVDGQCKGDRICVDGRCASP